MTYFAFRAFAASGTATLYTSPSGTQSVTTGQSFTVAVRISSGASVPVTGASVYLSYPADKLQVTGQSYAGSAYNTQLVESNSGGILRMDRAAFPSISGGDQLFAQVTFKALATGSASVSFTGSSIVTSGEDDSNILTQMNGVTYNISAPAAPSPSTGGSSGSSSGSTSSGSTAAPKSSSSSPGQSAPRSSGSSTAPAGSPSAPAAGGTTVTDNGSAVTDSPVSTIEIAVTDSKNKPVQGADVTANGKTVKTDGQGIARFANIPVGQQKIAIQYNGKKTNKTVQVKDGATSASPQRFNVSIPRNKFNPAVLVIPLVVLAAAGVLFLQPWKNRFATTSLGADISEDIVTSDRLFVETPSQSSQGPGATYAPEGEGKTASSPTPVSPHLEPNTTIKPSAPLKP